MNFKIFFKKVKSLVDVLSMLVQIETVLMKI